MFASPLHRTSVEIAPYEKIREAGYVLIILAQGLPVENLMFDEARLGYSKSVALDIKLQFTGNQRFDGISRSGYWDICRVKRYNEEEPTGDEQMRFTEGIQAVQAIRRKECNRIRAMALHYMNQEQLAFTTHLFPVDLLSSMPRLEYFFGNYLEPYRSHPVYIRNTGPLDAPQLKSLHLVIYNVEDAALEVFHDIANCLDASRLRCLAVEGSPYGTELRWMGLPLRRNPQLHELRISYFLLEESDYWADFFTPLTDLKTLIISRMSPTKRIFTVNLPLTS
ncbi:hypothetical protein M422DRAFT_270894 [Sphaerobolus stellatus SS14]|uniref:Uncharacterized protein n=1 Tax=Sphaerobolus stellatus (strain SS14) TaxID=990650 RepID=A0A0C9U1J5_SPHS4|nr:hypothetical protein M422DRAFT_270894 [Sphaerobolus stellatus SS14]